MQEGFLREGVWGRPRPSSSCTLRPPPNPLLPLPLPPSSLLPDPLATSALLCPTCFHCAGVHDTDY